jgi:hypothetical protein
MKIIPDMLAPFLYVEAEIVLLYTLMSVDPYSWLYSRDVNLVARVGPGTNPHCACVGVVRPMPQVSGTGHHMVVGGQAHYTPI